MTRTPKATGLPTETAFRTTLEEIYSTAMVSFYLASSMEETVKILFHVKETMRINITSVLGPTKGMELNSGIAYELLSWIYFHTRCLGQLDGEFHPPAAPHPPHPPATGC